MMDIATHRAEGTAMEETSAFPKTRKIEKCLK